jgi:hypothetical protein
LAGTTGSWRRLLMAGLLLWPEADSSLSWDFDRFWKSGVKPGQKSDSQMLENQKSEIQMSGNQISD